jgi:hypothetical protein
MEAILNILINNWESFSLWVTNQPTFVEVAFGVGLFYVVLLLVKAAFKVIVFLFSGLFSVPGRFKKQKDLRTKIQNKKPVSTGEEAPPFVFR